MKREKEKALCTTLFNFPTHYIKKSATKTLNHMTGILYRVDSFHFRNIIHLSLPRMDTEWCVSPHNLKLCCFSFIINNDMTHSCFN